MGWYSVDMGHVVDPLDRQMDCSHLYYHRLTRVHCLRLYTTTCKLIANYHLQIIFISKSSLSVDVFTQFADNFVLQHNR